MKKLLLLIFALALFAVTPQVVWCNEEAAAVKSKYFEIKVVPASTGTPNIVVKSEILGRTPILDPEVANIQGRPIEENLDDLGVRAATFKLFATAVSQQINNYPMQVRYDTVMDVVKELNEAGVVLTEACGGTIDGTLKGSKIIGDLQDQTNQLQGQVTMINGYVDSRKLAEQGDTGFDVTIKPGGLPGNISQEFGVYLPSGEPLNDSSFAFSYGNAGGRQQWPSHKLFIVGFNGPGGFTFYGCHKLPYPIPATGVTVRVVPLGQELTLTGLDDSICHHGLPDSSRSHLLRSGLLASR